MNETLKVILIGVAIGAGLNLAQVVTTWRLGVELSEATAARAESLQELEICDASYDRHVETIGSLKTENYTIRGCVYRVRGYSNPLVGAYGGWECPEKGVQR